MTTSPTTAATTTTAFPGGQLSAVAVAAATALALVFFMVTSVTSAAWTDTTDNANNAWATGTVSLTDDDAGVAMFSVINLVPGQTVGNSITVSNDSTVPLDVRLYGANLADTDLLAQYLNLTIGTTDGASDVYSGTVLAFSAAHTTFGTGTSVIALAAAGTQTYHFAVTLDANTPEAFQTTTAGIDFIWEGQTQ